MNLSTTSIASVPEYVKNPKHPSPEEPNKMPHKPTVLVIDDEIPILESISDLLEDDFDVLTANNAPDALKLLENNEIAVILSDQRMPGMTGDVFLKEAQKLSEATRILITGYADMEALVSAVNNGQIYAYLSKPWEPEELTLTIFKALDHYSLVRQLSHERNLLHALMDNIPDAIYFKDAQAKFTRLNQATANLWEIDDPAQIIGKTHADMLDKTTSDIDKAEKELLKNGHPIIDKVVSVAKPNHAPKWLSITKVPIRNHTNDIVGLVGISRDITERKQMDERLLLIHKATAEIAQSSDLNQALKNVLRIVCRTTNSAYGEVWLPNATQSELQFAGVTYDTFDTLENFIHLSKNLTFLPGVGLAGKTWQQKRPQFLSDLIDKPGQFVRSSIAQKAGLETGFAIPIIDADQVLAVLVFLSNTLPQNLQEHIELADIIAGQLGASIRRKQVETALQESEKRLETLINHLPNGVCLLDANCCIVLANPLAKEHLKTLGFDPDQTNIANIANLGNIDIDTLLTPRADGLPHELVTESKEAQTFELTSASIYDSQDIETGYALIIRDITEERNTRERIQNQYRLASVGQLAAGIAHDFNNILTVIIGSAQLLTLDDNVNKLVGEDLRVIYEQGQRAAQMVRQVLDFSRESKAERKATDVIPFLKEATKLLTRAIPADIEMTTPIHIPTCTIEANLTQLQQVINNMAINAQHAMPNGGQLTITVNTTLLTLENRPAPHLDPGEWLSIAVSDTGHGIPPHVIEHIFEPFFTTKPPGEGTGLGLAQSFGIIQEHGGHINVETEVGKGTTFTIYLPVNITAVAREETAVADIPKGQGETILLVEDQAEVRRIAHSLLETLNYRVIPATNGEEALELFESGQHTFDLIFTDVTMPKINGLELAKKVKAQAPDMPIVIVSGYVAKDKWAHFAPYTDAHLDKPLKMDEVANTVAEQLQNQ